MSEADILNPKQAIVLFDGVCHFCDASVNFIFARDSKNRFRFAPLQSETGQRLVKKYNLETVDSVILIENNRAFIRSTAALRIARKLDGAWSWLYAFIVVPRVVRDAAYELFSRNRYAMFGKKEHCTLPTPALRARFLDVVCDV